MAQNIYDDPEFFTAYSGLPRSIGGLDDAPEWPTLRSFLPDVAGLRVVDLGCGFGWFCRWAADAGAASVLGIDLSERMLDRARADTSGGAPITYRIADLDQLELPAGGFDVAYSSLVLHYLTNLDRFLATVHAALAPGGAFVFSAEHPLFTAPTDMSFLELPDGRTVWPLDRYLDEGPRRRDWLAPDVLKQHRTIATYLRLLRDAGFDLVDLVEWGPSREELEAHPDWHDEQARPPFLLVSARAD